MSEETKIKEIIAGFLKTSPDSISPDTAIGKQAVSGSILLHRMYAKLAEIGYPVTGSKRNIETFGQLMERLGKGNQANTQSPAPSVRPQVNRSQPLLSLGSVGIDMEKVSRFEPQDDYRTSPFYSETFSPEEISYCILQPNPLQSFAGRFAAKEAIVKADNRLRDTPFNQISISADPEGRPTFPGFQISISHTDTDAIAIAIAIAIAT